MIDRRIASPAVGTTPRHVAIIMDGNRRWADARNLAAHHGHRAGAQALRRTVAAAATLGIEILTVYAFSEENWRRGAREVRLLMNLVRTLALREAAALRAENVRVRSIGRTWALPAPTRAAVETLERETASCTGMQLNLALNYGARTELGDAVRALAVDVRAGRLAVDAIDDESVAAYLYTAGMPDPDLLIRTGGELRISNFLLYQIAYTELWATPVPWPEFEASHLAAACADFASRKRRFGT